MAEYKKEKEKGLIINFSGNQFDNKSAKIENCKEMKKWETKINIPPKEFFEKTSYSHYHWIETIRRTKYKGLKSFLESADDGDFVLDHFMLAIDAAPELNPFRNIELRLNKLLDKWQTAWKEHENQREIFKMAIEMQKGFIKYPDIDSKILKKLDKFLEVTHIPRIGKIFISYDKEKNKYVEKLAKYLKKAKFLVWYDKEIPTGSNWEKEILDNLQGCSMLIVVMTERGEKSEWVNKEIDFAQELKKPIVPLLLEGNHYNRFDKIQCENVEGEKMPDISILRSLL